MATYISLLRYTQQGITSLKQAPGRIDASRKAYKALGAELKALYLVMGRYDIVALVEAPDDTVAVKAALSLGSKGNVTSETLRAFSEEEFRKFVTELP
jgi:uncharacterized protein with GYD domain